MTYSIETPWHQEPDGSWTHYAIPGISISRDLGRAKPGRPSWLITTPSGVEARCWSFIAAKRVAEAIALAGAEGMPR